MSSESNTTKTAEEWFQEGLAASRTGDNAGCFEAYKKAVELEPDHFLAHFNLGIRYGKIPMNAEAAKCFREALRLKPESPMVHYSLAVVSNLVGEMDETLKHYKEAIRINPEFAKAHSNLAMVYYSFKQGRETIHHLLKSAEQFEQTGDTRMLDNAKELIRECSKEFGLDPEECRAL